MEQESNKIENIGKIEKGINDREWARLLGSCPTGIRTVAESSMINNDIYVTKEAMEEILYWNEDANVRPRGYSEEREKLIFDDEVNIDPDLFRQIVDGFIIPTG
jgi:hypothetical protein